MGSFLPTLPFKLRGLDSYPGGTCTHWFMPAFAGRTHFDTDLPRKGALQLARSVESRLFCSILKALQRQYGSR